MLSERLDASQEQCSEFETEIPIAHIEDGFPKE